MKRKEIKDVWISEDAIQLIIYLQRCRYRIEFGRRLMKKFTQEELVEVIDLFRHDIRDELKKLVKLEDDIIASIVFEESEFKNGVRIDVFTNDKFQTNEVVEDLVNLFIKIDTTFWNIENLYLKKNIYDHSENTSQK